MEVGVFQALIRVAIAATAMAVFATPQIAAERQTGPATAAAASREAQLAQGWNALAGGKSEVAAKTAAGLLKASPKDHDAASLAVAAGAAANGPAALRAYEQWLGAAGHEDPFLLETVAISFLRELAGADSSTRVAALAELSARGDRQARETIDQLATGGQLPVSVEASLAAAGDAAAFQRLRSHVEQQNPADKSAAIDALRASGQPGAAGIIVSALKDQAPPSRAAAATALADLNASEAIGELRAALGAEQDPQVRGAMRLALGRLGDAAGQEALTIERNSAVPARRLDLLAADANRDANGAWVQQAEAMLQDSDPVARLRAAELLVRHGHAARASSTLENAFSAASAPVRTVAARTLAGALASQQDYARLRKMLTDQVAEVRLYAARALLIR
jgi:HEAT repeat protein